MANTELFENEIKDFPTTFSALGSDDQQLVLDELRRLHYDLLKMKNHVEKKALSLIGFATLLVGGTNIFKSTFGMDNQKLSSSTFRFASISFVAVICVFGLLSLAYAVSSTRIYSLATVSEAEIIKGNRLDISLEYYKCTLYNDIALTKKSKSLEISQTFVLICIPILLLYLVFCFAHQL
ncbi:MAG: hypothetical protein KKF77_15925 [Proteobacteria bacterium]|nr:hypothetical protein [Pseudomonadota bacterium]